jgi:integrase
VAGVRKIKKTGKWEVAVRHKDLPNGRKFFTFDDEAAAREYARQWDGLVERGAALPSELLEHTPAHLKTPLAVAIREWLNTGRPSTSDQELLALLVHEVGAVTFAEFKYAWVERWIEAMKLRRNFAPGTIRKRVGALSRAIDAYLRKHELELQNPLKLLPDRYSVYNDVDAEKVQAVGLKVKRDEVRQRRLEPGEEQRIMAQLKDRPHLRLLFLVILHTGARLKEAYTLMRKQIDLKAKVIRFKKSKQWYGKVAFKDVPIKPELYVVLEAHMREHPGLPTADLFPWLEHYGDERAVSAHLSEQFARVFEAAGCEGLKEHDLRHEATCRWYELRGANGTWLLHDKEIHRIMGWSEKSTMSQLYASFRGEDLAARLWGTGA